MKVRIIVRSVPTTVTNALKWLILHHLKKMNRSCSASTVLQISSLIRQWLCVSIKNAETTSTTKISQPTASLVLQDAWIAQVPRPARSAQKTTKLMIMRLVSPDVIFSNTMILIKKFVTLVKFKTAPDALMLRLVSSANKDSVCKKMILKTSV